MNNQLITNLTKLNIEQPYISVDYIKKKILNISIKDIRKEKYKKLF